jgi:hypothetical protein
MNLDDDLRQRIIGEDIGEGQLAQIADVCNRYPNLELELTGPDEVCTDGEVVELLVTVKRPDVED